VHMEPSNRNISRLDCIFCIYISLAPIGIAGGAIAGFGGGHMDSASVHRQYNRPRASSAFRRLNSADCPSLMNIAFKEDKLTSPSES
jgi:hypothetical protein